MRVRIQALGRLGLKNAAIASLLRVNIKTVVKWKTRSSLQDLPRPKAPHILTPDVKRAIESLCRDRWGASTRHVAKTLNGSAAFAETGRSISHSTVCSFLRSTDWGRVAYRAQVKPMLSQRNIADRLAFCNAIRVQQYCENTQYSRYLLQQILFTDESIVELFPKPKPNAQNMRIRTSDPDNRDPIFKPKAGLKIMIAGGLSSRGLTALHIVEAGATVTGAYYRDKMLSIYFAALPDHLGNMEDSGERCVLFDDAAATVFMQDGAPAHTANLTLAALRHRFGTVWSKGIWPGNSPDLNPIENIWPIIQDSVYIEPRPRTRADLIARVQQAWGSISIELCQRLVFSFPRRIDECLAKFGRTTNY
jgi:hypothetical protein